MKMKKTSIYLVLLVFVIATNIVSAGFFGNLATVLGGKIATPQPQTNPTKNLVLQPTTTTCGTTNSTNSTRNTNTNICQKIHGRGMHFWCRMFEWNL